MAVIMRIPPQCGVLDCKKKVHAISFENDTDPLHGQMRLFCKEHYNLFMQAVEMIEEERANGTRKN